MERRRIPRDVPFEFGRRFGQVWSDLECRHRRPAGRVSLTVLSSPPPVSRSPSSKPSSHETLTSRRAAEGWAQNLWTSPGRGSTWDGSHIGVQQPPKDLEQLEQGVQRSRRHLVHPPCARLERCGAGCAHCRGDLRMTATDDGVAAVDAAQGLANECRREGESVKVDA
jgi:hypothetical protein